MSTAARGVESRVRRALDDHGLLLAHDAKLPSVTAIVAGAPIKGSWWGHEKGHQIFELFQAIEDDAAFAKLVRGKVTLVHRRLWPALAGIGAARAAWQTHALDAAARALLARVDASPAPLRTDALAKPDRPAAIDLERRLLVHADDIHTEAGHHTRVLQSWPAWARAHAVVPLADAPARRALEAAAASLGTGATLPWTTK